MKKTRSKKSRDTVPLRKAAKTFGIYKVNSSTLGKGEGNEFLWYVSFTGLRERGRKDVI